MDEKAKQALKKWIESSELKRQKEEEIIRIDGDMSSLAQQVFENSDGNTIQFNGKWYNVRYRKRSGKYYICEMEQKPGSWLKKNSEV